MSARVRNSLNRPPRQISVCRSELCGWPRRNVIIPSEQTSESSKDYNYDTNSDNELEYDNYKHPIPVDTDTIHVWVFNVIV